MPRRRWLPAAVVLVAGACGPDSQVPTDPASVAAAPDAPVALALARSTEVVMVSAGDSHTCALTDTGAAWCWGDASLVGAEESGLSAPFPVRVAGARRYTTISAGAVNTCAIALTGRAFCWGSNLNGELGNGGTMPGSRVPVAVAGGLLFKTLSVGGHHTCAIDLEDHAWCWGINSQGQLGDGTSGTVRRRPVRVLGQLRFDRISAGSLHTCAITVGRRAFCWGEASSGRLGIGSQLFGVRTRPVKVAGDLIFTRISAGSGHTCGLVRSMTARCWGGNSSGQIGDGTLEDRFGPTIVADGLLWEGIAAGTSHSCGVTGSGQMLCWGSNFHGQLGDGIPFDHPIPAAVAGEVRFRRVTSGDNHSCGISMDRWVYCWGDNVSGQLGAGPGLGSPVPVAITSGP